MILLVSGATTTLARFKGHPGLGVLLTPAAGNSVSAAASLGMNWACDNAAFSGFDADAYFGLVTRVAFHLWRKRSSSPPLWITAPDVVADAAATIRLFATWAPCLRQHELPIAFVAQDGASVTEVPWDMIACLFIGGTTAWKLSDDARALALEAKCRGKLVHMGRVNSRRRLQIAASFGVDSIDGSSFSRFPDAKIPSALSWRDDALARAPLEARFDGCHP